MKKPASTENLRQLAERAKSFMNGQNSELAEAVAEAVIEIENVKADKTKSVPITISPSGWNSDDTSVYPYFYDISVNGISEKDIADIVILPESMSAAVECGFCPTSQTFNGKIRVRSINVPKSTLLAEYIIHDGKE